MIVALSRQQEHWHLLLEVVEVMEAVLEVVLEGPWASVQVSSLRSSPMAVCPCSLLDKTFRKCDEERLETCRHFAHAHCNCLSYRRSCGNTGMES